MTEPAAPDTELTGETKADPEPASQKWYETSAGRAAASMVSIGFLGLVVAAMLVLTQRAQDAGSATEISEPEPPTATAPETPSATSAVPTVSAPPTTSRAPASPSSVRPTATPAVPTRTSIAPRPAAPAPQLAPAPAAPTTVPTTPAEPTTEASEPPQMPELNVTRGPIEMSPPRGDPATEE